jgi:hypothetical protein
MIKHNPKSENPEYIGTSLLCNGNKGNRAWHAHPSGLVLTNESEKDPQSLFPGYPHSEGEGVR